MTIKLYFSNRLEQLGEKLSDLIVGDSYRKLNIFEAPVVIVPNGNLAKWLKLFLAEKNAIFMNVDFQYLESGMWSILKALDPGDNPPELLDNNLLKVMLLHALQNTGNDDSDFLPMSMYLFGKDGNRTQDYAPRLWQLTEKMSHLFREYEFHRVDMIRKWSEGIVIRDDMERCQQKLYLRLKAMRDEMTDRTGKRILSMMEYAQEVLPGFPSDGEEINHRKPVHFFGLSQVSVFHLQVIHRLQAHYDISIYALNPCREFWEDVKTPREKRWIERKNVKTLAIRSEEREKGELFHQDDNKLLAAWGKPGRESIRLLCELTDYEFSACFSAERPADNILHRIQKDILTLCSKTQDTERLEQDRSLQILACPGVYREVETVYNSILFNLEQNKDLQLTDIAILVPDISTYKPVFDSVFNRKPKRLSYNLVDSNAEIESVYGRAIWGILTLAFGRFSRKEVFDLILNPCFMSRWKIDHDEAQAWAEWTDALNIFHTFDRDTKSARGYPPGDTYTWKQGLQRLRLSRILSTPDTHSKDGFEHFHELVPFSDLNTSDVDQVEKFCVVIEALHHAVISLNIREATGKQWKEVFFDVCDQLIEIPEEFKGESLVQRTLIQAFDNLKTYDALQDEQSTQKLGLGLIREFIRANLSSISGGYGDYLTSGVTISALQPMRPIPFNIVYILGMEEGVFPGKADASTLDLRLLKRRIGDINLPERNCYLFLEMLLSVRDKLYISFVSRDLQRDRTLQPCSVISRLRRYVEQEILPHGHDFRIPDIPLKGSSERYLNTEAIYPGSDVLVNYSLADRLAYYRTNRLWKYFNQRASSDDLRRVDSFFPNLSFDVHKPKETDQGVEKVTSRQLRRFLEDPVKQNMQRHLGLYDEEETIEDLVLWEDEPFFSDFPLDYNLKMGPLKLWLDAVVSSVDTHAERPAIEEFYDLFYEDCRRKGRTPEYPFSDLDKEALLEHVFKIAETMTPVLIQMESAIELYRMVFIGEQIDEYLPACSSLGVKRFDPLSFTVETKNHTSNTVVSEVELHGQFPWVWKDPEERWHALILTGSRTPPKEPDKYVLEPVIFYMFCLMGNDGSQWIGESGITFHMVYREKVKDRTYIFKREAAEAYLTGLVSDYLNQESIAWLPFKEVTSRLIKPHKMPDDEVNDLVRESYVTELKEAYSEVADYLTRITRPIIPLEAFNMVRRRFRIYFE